MKEFCAWVGTGFLKLLLIVAAIGAILPIMAFGCDVGTELLVGGYLPEGTYVMYKNGEDPVEFTISKDAEYRKGKDKSGHYYVTDIDGVTYSTFYSDGAMHFRSGIVGYVSAIKSEILHRDGDVFYVTRGQTTIQELWFAPKGNEAAIQKAEQMSGYSK